MAYVAVLGAPLQTNTGWAQLPQHISNVIDMSSIVPKVMSWPTWCEMAAIEGLNGQGSVATELNTLTPGNLVTALSRQLHLGPQGHTINSSLASLQPPQLGRPRARTAPTVFRDTAPDESESPPSTSPFSRSRDLPSYEKYPGWNINPRLRSASLSIAPRGRPISRPRRTVERVLDPAQVWPHIPAHADVTQCPTSGGISSTPQHLDIPLFDWFCDGLGGFEYTPDSPSTPPSLSRASSTSSMHRRPRSRSRSSMHYAKPSSSVAAGDGTSSPERPKSYKNREYNGRDEFSGRRLHMEEGFLETVLGDNPSLRVLLDNILGSSWRQDHILEPNYGAKNDDVSQGLNLSIEPGSSVLLAFILRAGEEYTCVLCKEVLSTRSARQLGHVRGHIDLRPFPCEGCDSCDPKYIYCCLLSFIGVLTCP